VILEVFRFCQRIARYDGPGAAGTVERVQETYPGVSPEAVTQAFQLGYKRGYADAGEYIADWIEEEND
jgi:hypothetical protein